MIRVKKKRYPEAMSYFYKAVAVDPNNLAAHLNIGSIALDRESRTYTISFRT